uniref:Claudin n=1 Tax=Oryzias melastigma TaxID=30732 RepID=A0A3B3BI70_ORYME
MRKRLIQIFGFLISSMGWLFILCTMAMDYWRITQIGGQGGSFIIKVAWYWSNLWKDCFTDSTAVTNCRDYAVLWSVNYVQAVRGLLMCGLTIGFFAVVCCFIGMDCTYIGGAEQTKDKLVFSGAVFHFRQKCFAIIYFSDLIETSSHRCVKHCCLLLIHQQGCQGRLRSQRARSLKVKFLLYDLGPPIFLGLVGCFLIFFGAILYAVTVFRVVYRKR